MSWILMRVTPLRMLGQEGTLLVEALVLELLGRCAHMAVCRTPNSDWVS